VYAPQPLPVPAPTLLHLIGLLDADLIASFAALSTELAQPAGGTVIVEVRDLHVSGEAMMGGLIEAVRAARAAGRDVRLVAKSLPWRRLVRSELSTQPPVDPTLQAAVRRTVILAHSAGYAESPNGKKKPR
jgi:anti-anti-sigma regulatory factor